MAISMETVWRLDQERTNQNAQIYLKTILPCNKIIYLPLELEK